MNGKSLFWQYVDLARNKTATDDQRQYAGVLMTARTILGDDANLFALLEEAESKGLQMELMSPDVDGPSEPYGVRLSVPAELLQ